MALNAKDEISQAHVFQDIAEFWEFQLNNEIYLRNHSDVIRGSKEYFEIILSARQKFIYYFRPMINYLKEGPSKNLLEVGCGMGTDSLVFEREGFNVTGIDLAPAHLSLAEKLFGLYRLSGSFTVGNAQILPFPSDTFGCVYSFGVLHHTPEPKKGIQEIHRVLMPKGRAVIMLYHKWSLNNLAHFLTGRGYENVKEGADAPVTYRFGKSEIEKMCRGFSACDIQTQYLFGAGWGKLYNIVPKPIYLLLSKLIGWHLVIYLQK